MAGFGSAKPQSGQNKVRLNEEVDVYNFPDGQWVTVRYCGPMVSRAWHWLEIYSEKGKNGKSRFPKLCLCYDPEKQEYTDDNCAYHDMSNPQQVFHGNMIVRDLQEDEPRKKAPHTGREKKAVKVDGQVYHFKEIGSRSWTPVRVHENMAASYIEQKIQSLKPLNKWKINGEVKTFHVDHPKYGRNVQVKYNSKGTGTGKWDVMLGEKAPLTDEEKAYLFYNFEGLKSLTPEKPDAAKAEAKRLADKLVADDGDEKSGKGKSRRDVEDDDDEEKPRKKKTSYYDDDEDDDTLPDDDDDEEEEKLRKKLKSGKKKEKLLLSKKKKKPSRDLDDDDDDDDLDDVDEI